MTLVSDIVTRAFRKIGVGAVGEALEADDLADGVIALNAMLHGWKLRDVDISHTDVEAADTFPLAAEYEEGTVYLLAGRLSPDYEVPASFDADDWFRAIQAAYATITESTVPSALTSMPSQTDRSYGA